MLWLLLALSAPLAFEANGVSLGAPESAVRERFPSAHCRALEWSSLAADRRCDDSRASVAGVRARVTFYLKKDAVEAFDVRFYTQDLEPLLGELRKRYGKPASEGREKIEREGKRPREFYRARWQANGAQAVLTTELDKRRISLLASRGNFEEEIYRAR